MKREEAYLKMPDWRIGNEMGGMMAMRGIRVETMEMRGIRVGMWGKGRRIIFQINL